MSQFQRHEPCPKCREMGVDKSGNNLGVWDDHKYCFSCGYVEINNSLNLNRITNNKKSQDVSAYIELPSDITTVLPERAVKWLDKYELTETEKNQFLWSEQYQRLIYPVYDLYDNLLFYQGRAFNQDNGKHSKYSTQGFGNKIFHLIGPEQPRLIVVEDVVSALKISRQAYVMPLWGSQISPERVRMLSGMVFKLWIWLDKDKAEYSLKTRQMASPYFDEVRCIITDKDPKEYSNDKIMEIIK